MDNVYHSYLELLDTLRSNVEELSALAKRKIEAAQNDDLVALDEVLKREQALALSFRGLEQSKERLLGEMGCPLEDNPNFDPHRAHPPKFAALNNEERAALIAKDPRYGRIVCRCETVTEGEIVQAIHRNPPARSLDAVKRRTRTGMGRCQGGFCTPVAVELLARELGIPPEEVTKAGGASRLLTGKTKSTGGKLDGTA